MKRLLSASFLILFAASFIFLHDGCARPQNKTVKNVILLIPDGTSLASVSTARWFQHYLNPDATRLNIDPYLCGTILTFCSNAPIGDSAPTTSCYMTGYPSRAGYVSTYPVADPANDILPMDSLKAYQPLITLLEAARIAQHKSTGLVFTCEFPHATPADCSAHSYRRDRYGWIAPQIVHNQIDVVIGGGVSLLNDENKRFLQNEGYGLFLNDINGFRNYSGDKMWALFADKDMAYDIDRNPEQEPSLAEMTKIAIDKLSRNKNGFFLMVEGSKIDWAAHANDARAIISDVLAFDKACGEAFRFAESDGETLVVVVPDHGNSGISIGSNKCPGYSTLTKDQLFGNVAKFKTSVDALIRVLHDTPPDGLRQTVLELTGIALTDEEYQLLLQTADYHLSALSDEERMKGSKLTKEVAKILDKYTCFGFTTTGHTGEEVFLAVYDPRPGGRMTGFHTNVELNHYIRNAMGLEKQFESLTGEYFAKHTDVFKNYTFTVDTLSDNPVLTVKNKETTLEIHPNTNIAKCNGKELKLNSVVVYVDKNNTFYLPKSMEKLLMR
ncbi:MAG: alkaline phosphatase [Dysgonamonadaceae bacterium]|jgi:alkaline phosphatase|nr:alkaline phosphatase [Dysgonamonadaceae bacterium]